MIKQVFNCASCPFCRYHSEHSWGSNVCCHEKNGQSAYEDLIKDTSKTPKWCPLKKEEYTIKYNKSAKPKEIKEKIKPASKKALRISKEIVDEVSIQVDKLFNDIEFKEGD